MRRILTRNQFLERVETNSFSRYTEVNEAFKNDVNWGDSWLGRLFFSVTRSVKIGYNLTKVDPLLQQLRDQLNILVTESFTAEKANEFNLLYIKSVLEEIKDICLSKQTSEEKLEILIGWDGQTPMWDSKNTKSDARKIKPIGGRTSVLQNIIDKITVLPNLKKFQGVERDAFLDILSDFGEDLRKLTVPDPGGNTPNLTFSQRVNILMKKYMVLTSYKFDTGNSGENKKILKNYWNFINENENQNTTLGQLKGAASELATKAEELSDEELKKSPQLAKFKDEFKKLTDPDKEKIKKVQVEEEDLEGNLLQTTINLLEIETGDQKQETTTNEPKLEVGKEYLNKNGKVCMITQPKKEIDPSLVFVIYRDEKTKRYYKGSVSGVIKKVDLQPYKGTDTKKDDKGNPKVFNTKFNDSVVNSKYFGELLREVHRPGGPGPGAPANQNQRKEVSDIWNHYFKDIDDKNPSRLTQREADELLEMDRTGTDTKAIDIGKNPDAIVGIARTFGRAHELYYTPTIPSGATDRRVSDKTFRKYILLSKESSSRSDSKSPGYGPWAVKSIWNKWTDGVMKITQDPEMKKIFSNVDFVVPSKLITSNESKIFEAESEGGGKKQTDGQILFKFMQEMITKEGAANFEENRKKLMMDYFGVKDTTPTTSPTKKPIADEDKGKNNFFWSPLSSFSEIKKDRIIALPVEDTTNVGHEIIYLHPIKEVNYNNKKCWQVRMTFGYQLLIDEYVEKAENGKYKDFEYPNWTQSLKQKWTDDGKQIFYGLIYLDNNDKISLIYLNATKDANFGEKDKLYVDKERFKFLKRKTARPKGSSVEVLFADLRRNDENGNVKIVDPSTLKLDGETIKPSEVFAKKLQWNSGKNLEETMKEIVEKDFVKS